MVYNERPFIHEDLNYRAGFDAALVHEYRSTKAVIETMQEHLQDFEFIKDIRNRSVNP